MTIKSVKPIGNRILAKRVKKQQVVKGILLPDSASPPENKLEVIAIGEAVKINVKVGEFVMVERFAGQVVTIEDEEHTILKADDIVAVVE